MPNARRNRRIRIGLIGAASMALIAATAGGAMGWIMGGTTDAIREYDRKAESTVPGAGTTRIVSEDPAADVDLSTPAATDAANALPANGWVPVHNAIQWATPVVAGQPLSGLSLRNGDQDVTIVAHLAARAADGAWTPVASMTVSPGREGIIHPPPGDYSMTLVAAPAGMAFDQVAALPHSPATLFRMEPVTTPTRIEPVRFSVSKGAIRRLPSPASGPTAPRPMPASNAAAGPSAPIMTITPADPAARERPDAPDDGTWHDPPVDDRTSDQAPTELR